MSRLRTKLPPPTSLITFEAAGRHLNFTHAGSELNVTQAAVSRQIKVLEEDLGLALFNRLHRGLELTTEGRHLHTSVTMGLEHIANTANELRTGSRTAGITISCSVTFASYWLLARIASYRNHYPDTDIKLLAAAKVRDLIAKNVDLAVRYGKGNWGNVVADHLFDNYVFPVCSPTYLDKHGPFTNLKEIAGASLLHLKQFDRNWVSWESWFEYFNESLPDSTYDIQFDNYTVLISAALRGDGLALCSSHLAEDFIARKELVRPIEARLPSEYSFFLLRSEERELRPEAKKFHSWLLAEAHRSGLSRRTRTPT